MSQSRFGLIRDAFPCIIRNIFPCPENVVISLHGSLFLSWNKNSLDANIFRHIAKSARYITVLGENSYSKLLDLGIDEKKIVLLENTSLIKSLSSDEVLSKHKNSCDKNEFNVLYLSSLIESKGYIVFLDSIHLVEEKLKNVDMNLKINFYLCGKITPSIYQSTSLSTCSDVEKLIYSHTLRVSSYTSVTLEWINGIDGLEKEKMFHAANVFCVAK
ncbi:MAG: glycosyltransferase family 4 protein [Leptolyngbyaceae cyanobacterium SU_3_3]|nr:glycosyltransferase family 4 protein [Leptolyngbyaceae cyanobacterium SU_3_3]